MKRELAIAVVLTAAASAVQADIILNGVLDGDTYANSEVVSWFNAHQNANSIYGDFNNQFANTTIRYGADQLGGDNSNTPYFFLFVEVPIYAKNMIWDSRIGPNNYPVSNTDPNAGLIEGDLLSYRVHHETHHGVGDLRLDFGGATGSEKAVFVDGNGNDLFEADLDGNADNAFGLIGFKDSVDYLFDNNLATEDLSLARLRTMSFEFQFELDTDINDELLGYIRNGIEFHLSPERGLPVPAPGALTLLGIAGIAARRRRRS